MTNNLTPWLVLGGIVLLSLVWKGYIKIPSLGQFKTPAAPASPLDVAKDVMKGSVDLSSMTSHELGVLMALAARREAEQHVAQTIAKDAAEKLKATFTAPFSPAGQQDPAQATPPAGGQS